MLPPPIDMLPGRRPELSSPGDVVPLLWGRIVEIEEPQSGATRRIALDDPEQPAYQRLFLALEQACAATLGAEVEGVAPVIPGCGADGLRLVTMHRCRAEAGLLFLGGNGAGIAAVDGGPKVLPADARGAGEWLFRAESSSPSVRASWGLYVVAELRAALGAAAHALALESCRELASEDASALVEQAEAARDALLDRTDSARALLDLALTETYRGAIDSLEMRTRATRGLNDSLLERLKLYAPVPYAAFTPQQGELAQEPDPDGRYAVVRAPDDPMVERAAAWLERSGTPIFDAGLVRLAEDALLSGFAHAMRVHEPLGLGGLAADDVEGVLSRLSLSPEQVVEAAAHLEERARVRGVAEARVRHAALPAGLSVVGTREHESAGYVSAITAARATREEDDLRLYARAGLHHALEALRLSAQRALSREGLSSAVRSALRRAAAARDTAGTARVCQTQVGDTVDTQIELLAADDATARFELFRGELGLACARAPSCAAAQARVEPDATGKGFALSSQAGSPRFYLTQRGRDPDATEGRAVVAAFHAQPLDAPNERCALEPLSSAQHLSLRALHDAEILPIAPRRHEALSADLSLRPMPEDVVPLAHGRRLEVRDEQGQSSMLELGEPFGKARSLLLDAVAQACAAPSALFADGDVACGPLGLSRAEALACGAERLREAAISGAASLRLSGLTLLVRGEVERVTLRALAFELERRALVALSDVLDARRCPDESLGAAGDMAALSALSQGLTLLEDDAAVLLTGFEARATEAWPRAQERVDERIGRARSLAHSSLASARLFVATPFGLYEPAALSSGEPDPLDHAFVRFPVLTRPAMTAEDARAEQLLRASRVHPLLPDLSLTDGSVDAQKLASALSGTELASRLRQGLIAVDPDEYAALPASPGAFLEALGVSSMELRDAAVRMLQLSEHRATSLLPQPASTPVLTLSSEAVFAAPSAAHLVALSEGRAFAAQDALPHHYALRSLPQTLAHALDALTHARAGTSPARLSEVIDAYRARVEGSLSFEQLREGEARRFAIELEVAQGLDDARVLERYGLFSSDAGLSCALFGSVAQEPCEAQQFVFDASVAVVRRLGLVSGSRERVRVEGLSLGTPTSWDAELSRELREGRIYLVDREEKRALGAFSMAPLTRLPVRQVLAQSSAFDVPLLELLAFRVPGEGCSACRPSSVCEATRCDLGVCVRSPVPDGATCGQGQCVAGVCDTPGCGDGVRSDGTGVAPYEACDDGNLADGDGCSQSCVPELRSLEPSIAEGYPAGPARAVAVDGLGQQLLVYSADTLDGEQVSVRAARLDAFGVLAESERVVDASLPRGYLAAPSVAGLRDGGFAIVYSSPSIAGGAGIGVRILSPRGVLGPLLRVDDGDALAGVARVSPLDEGFVVVWTRKRTNESTELRARRFDDQGSAVAAAFSVGSAGEGREQVEPAIISSQGQVLIVWTERGGSGGSALLGRRFVGFGTPADALPFEIARGSVAQASLAVLSSDDYLVAFTNRASDAAGDVWRRVVRRFGSPLGGGDAAAWVATSAPESLPVVAGLGSAAVLAFQQGFQPSFAALIGDAAQASALDSVSAALSLSDRQDVSLASSPNGVWVVWSEKQDRRRALFAYLLPPNEAP